MNKQIQQLLAEVFGTFVLVFIGSTAIAAWGSGAGGVAPFAFGLGLIAALYMFGETSGGHFNPIVSLAMFLDRRMGAREVVPYWIAQFAGAVLAALALLLMSSSKDVALAATVPGSHGVRGAGKSARSPLPQCSRHSPPVPRSLPPPTAFRRS